MENDGSITGDVPLLPASDGRVMVANRVIEDPGVFPALQRWSESSFEVE